MLSTNGWTIVNNIKSHINILKKTHVKNDGQFQAMLRLTQHLYEKCINDMCDHAFDERDALILELLSLTKTLAKEIAEHDELDLEESDICKSIDNMTL